ncbi:SDR family NAD(P)-dependent oxidoreductase [Pseudonocardia thermophila]|nr:SDR family oxidoreductase [Pseudonocardia thermophila]
MTTDLAESGGASSGRVAVVTGAGSGIGLATARAFLAAGTTVIGLDVRDESPEPGMDWIRCDVTDDAAVAAAFARIRETHGKLDVLVNNAGIPAKGTIEEATDADWQAVFDVNVFGVARVTRHALPLLRLGESAVIVNVSSGAALVGTPLRAVYSASKGAVAALTRALAADLVDVPIRVNAIFPGAVHTPIRGEHEEDPGAAVRRLTERAPLGYLIEADEIARAILYLADPANRSLTGTGLRYDGGITELVNFGTK